MRFKRFESRALVLVFLAIVWVGITSTITIGAPQQAASASPAAPTFSADVAPIFYAKCVTCHRPGEVAPMSLITFKDVRPWASSIRDKVTTRVMPPWHADRQYGSFRNEQSLTQGEIDTIVKWVNANAPEGDPSRMPALPKFPEGWQIGTPDAVFAMPTTYAIPATGEIEYQYFEVPTNFTEDRWMQAGEVRAGDRAHVHHIIVYVKAPNPTPASSVMVNRPITSAAPAAAVCASGAASGRAPSGRAPCPGRRLTGRAHRRSDARQLGGR